MEGSKYADLIASYIAANYGKYDLRVFREVPIGTSIIGKKRRVDILVVRGPDALAIECKYQDVAGTVDEKIPYALDDLRAMRVPGTIVYAGAGFSEGVLHLLQGSEMGAALLRRPGFVEISIT